MDRHSLALLIPILALTIPVIAMIFKGLNRLAQIRLEEARLRIGSLTGGAELELAGLRGDVDDLRRELSEVQERVDFAERLLSKPREAARSPAAEDS
ncbi:MAG: hypothetical protein M3Q93_07490 [Gemmatimonadota bacterium]|nr:hypothetical protein [Gemmatimonadota bacterium]